MTRKGTHHSSSIEWLQASSGLHSEKCHPKYYYFVNTRQLANGTKCKKFFFTWKGEKKAKIPNVNPVI